jgi:NitT/TauT family transport system substrate-binding protein
MKKAALSLCLLLAGSAITPVAAEEFQKLSIVVFSPPSLGAFLPPVIKAQKLDEKNGLSITFAERTPDAYTAQFNSGEFQLGGSASLLTVGLADVRGVKVTHLFNLFDYWGAVVTSRPGVKSLKDVEGKDLAAAKGTTNYVMFDWFARQLGVDPKAFEMGDRTVVLNRPANIAIDIPLSSSTTSSERERMRGEIQEALAA